MKNLLLSVMLFSCVLTALCQTTFEKSYDYWPLGEGNVAFEHNGGFAMVGGAVIGGRNYLIVIKTDMYGDTVSVKKYDFGASTYSELWVRDAVTDHTGNKYFALSGVVDSANFVKFDSQWNLAWKKRLDNNYSIHKMILSSDGNIVAVGRGLNYSYYLSRLNTDGIIQWKAADIIYSQFGHLNFSSLHELPNNKIVLTSNWINNTEYSNTPSEIRTYSETGDSLSRIVLNSSFSANTILDSKALGEEMISFTQKPNDYTTTFLVRHRTDGTIISEKQLSSVKCLYRFIISGDKLFAIGSNSIYNYNSSSLNCYSLNGDNLWSSEFGSTGQKYFYSLKQCNDKGFLLAGFLEKNLASMPIPYMVKTDSLGKLSLVGLEDNRTHTARVFPIPANEYVVIETPGIESGNLFIYDVMGRLYDKLTISSERTVVNTTLLHEGVFVYNLMGSKHLVQGKFIIKR